jgi:hypothetical protein
MNTSMALKRTTFPETSITPKTEKLSSPQKHSSRHLIFKQKEANSKRQKPNRRRCALIKVTVFSRITQQTNPEMAIQI